MNKAEFLAGLRDALAGKCRCALCGGKLQSKYGRAGKYLRCRTHAVAPERCPGVSIRRDEAAQCVLEALQDCMARYLDREYLARHLRPPEAAAHRQEQLALRAARLEQALARQRACRKCARCCACFKRTPNSGCGCWPPTPRNCSLCWTVVRLTSP